MIFYIAYDGFPLIESSGIWKKIVGQTEALKHELGEAYYTALNCQTAYLMEGKETIEKEIAITREDYCRILVRWIEKYKVERTYVRYPFSDKWFIELLKYQQKNHIKTVLEIPTYPYDGELAYGRLKVEDLYYREEVRHYTDVITTYSAGGDIWGKPRICLANGVDVDHIKLSRKEKRERQLTLIGVSSGMAPWMGFERLIEGLRNYYQRGGAYEIKIKLVGKGAWEAYYKTQVKNCGLEKYVEFCGSLSGAELDLVYDQADVAVCSLGFYKIGATAGSPIKGAEYCARGIPAICGYTDTRFPDDVPFILNVPNDASPIDLKEVIAFYEKLSGQEGYREKIREYAVRFLSWHHIMEPVVKYFRESEHM